MTQIPLDLVPERKLYTVAELSLAVKELLETGFPDVWVTGEVSNFRAAASGHYYFTLKDASAQLRAVCFRNQARYLKFRPEDGLAVIARGHLSVYEARGEYQLYVEYLEPAGMGALQLAFEQLKKKLATEGLFDESRKKPLPVLSRAIGIVTSPSGAAVRDILRVIKRRFPNMSVFLYPATVQGASAAGEIVAGIEYFNQHPLADVIIVGRGGGSLEDLWPFNEETVARAIVASKVPIISAVGHETDFTISDFVADLRAPTPSAAAELVVRRREDFIAEVANRVHHMSQDIRLRISESRSELTELRMHRALQQFPTRVQERSQRIDESVAEMERSLRSRIEAARRQFLELTARLFRFEPGRLLEIRWIQIQHRKSQLGRIESEMSMLIAERLHAGREAWMRAFSGVTRYDLHGTLLLKLASVHERGAELQGRIGRIITGHRHRVEHYQSLLEERSPLTILNRGYSITRDAENRIVRDAAQVEIGEGLSIRLAQGKLGVTVREKEE
ncbi:MAG: exodeoxyribonuclease VII large subunit [Acidobacteria bacterium]|nr:MAG: exodeoxyribonuclease VII large subunit [Acidobacteriota bacterium]